MGISTLTTLATLQPVTYLHKDINGWIINASGLDSNIELSVMHQPRILSCNSGSIRGNHFHPNIEETIIFISGSWRIVLATPDLLTREETTVECAFQPWKLNIPHNVVHAIMNLSSEVCYIYHYANKSYDEDRSIHLAILNI